MACDAMLGKGVTNFPCDLPKGHDGPHATPSVMKTVVDRQAWEQQRNKMAAQPGPGLPWENTDGFQPGVQKPHPRQLVKCSFCPEQVPYEEMLQHVSSHVGRPNPALVPPLSSAVPEAPPGTPEHTPNGVIGRSSADALADHVAKHAKAPAQPMAPVFIMPPQYGQPQQPFVQGQVPGGGATGVMEAAQHFAEVIDPAAYRQGFGGTSPTDEAVADAYFALNQEDQDRADTRLLAELQTLLNRNSRENASNTPDFLLAEFLLGCLRCYEQSTNARDNWYQISSSMEGSSSG